MALEHCLHWLHLEPTHRGVGDVFFGLPQVCDQISVHICIRRLGVTKALDQVGMVDTLTVLLTVLQFCEAGRYIDKCCEL
jgi:hypothetical protein